MNKDAIKIVKRNKKDAAEKTGAVVETPKVETHTQRGIFNAVRNWIFERRENSRAEKVFSDDKISSWETMSENSE
ncbi:MAG TPA: hypothetical protein VK400_20610 [Pyrinomonadaceae bacterium]|nr:hypothetical protein [Pyrinomonadaceae bacterium]